MQLPVYKKPPVAFLFFLLCCGPVAAQYEEKDFTRYSVKDGLSDNGVTCLQQDAQGYLWIGTDAGLNRFDGSNFKKFYQGTPPLQLLSGSIVRLKRFGPDHLGIISKGGFQLLNTGDYSLKKYIIPDSSALSPHLNAVWDVHEMADRSYAVTTGSGFYVFSQEGKVILRHDAYQVKDIGKKRILYGREMFNIGNRRYLAYVNENGLAIYDDQKKLFREEDVPRSEWSIFLHDRGPDTAYWVVKFQLNQDTYIFIPYGQDKVISYNISSKKTRIASLPPHLSDSLNWESKITKLDDSSFALNSRTNGFYILKLDRSTGLLHCDGKKYLRNYKVLCLFMDKDKRLWAGTPDGLLKQELQAPVISAYRYPPPAGQKYTGGFNCAYRFKNRLYAGRFSLSKGLAIIDADNMQLIREVEFFGNNTSWNEIRTIEMYHPDTLWIGTNAGIIWYATATDRYGVLSDQPGFSWARNFSAVLAPVRSDGYAWICSMLDGKLVRYHIATRAYRLFTSQTTPALPFDKIKHIAYDAYGDVWIGGHSLARWNNRLQVFDTLITVYGGVNKFNDDIIVLRADDKGSLWMHNVYNGLLEYRIREKKFVPYTMKDGLPSDVVYALSPVINDKLWIAGNNQLSLFDTRKRHFTVFDADDGLPDQKPTGRRIYFDAASQYLYLFCNEFLARYPFSPERKKDLGSNLLIEEFRNWNTNVYYQPAAGLVFKPHENNLTIDYSIIDFGKSNYQFAYRLSDDEPWNPLGSQRSITLSNLPPGHYRLQLKASGKPGLEKTTIFPFTIRPPFWKTPFFIILAVVFLAGGAYLLYRIRIRHIRQKANVDKMLSQTEMKALQAQMNPHFIFNSLNSIREMILNNENKEASHYLSKFAHLIRITLDQSTQSLVSLRNTVDYLQRYAEMESIRNSLFTYEISVDNNLDIDEIFVPPMLIQPFIENALWHGVSATNKQIHIKIDFKKENQTLVCKIDDNGMGIRQSQVNRIAIGSRHQAHGITNIKNRVDLLNEKYNLHGRFTIEDKKDINGETGTLVTLHLPMEIKET